MKHTQINIGHEHFLEERIKLLEMKLMSKSQEIDLLKSSFLANISHEIRTPMNAIMGFSELLKEDGFDRNDSAVFIEGILKSGSSLLTIIDNLIQTARIESNNLEIEDNEINIHKTIAQIIEQHRNDQAYIERKNIEIRFANEFDNNGLSIINDLSKFKKILNQLIGNALKFTEKGRIDVGYSLKETNVEFFVRDTGIGIHKQKLNVIFEKFTRVKETPTRQYGGLGIGLTISKSLTELMGGEMNVISEPGIGSSFTFTLPFKSRFTPVQQKDISSQFAKTWINKPNFFLKKRIKPIKDDVSVSHNHVNMV
jgi:signal transduction histidine kinase